MDEFARLRNDIYLNFDRADPAGYLQLARALCGGREPLDPLLEAISLLHADAYAMTRARACGNEAPSSAAPLELLGRLGESACLDRYLADFARGRPEIAAAALASRGGAHAGGPRRAELACAVAAGLRPFDAACTAPLLRGNSDPDTLIDALAYAADAGLAELLPRIEALQQEPLPWGVRAEALAAVEDLRGGAQSSEQVANGTRGTTANGTRGTAATASPAGLAQSLFYGDPARMGKGASGGVGTLVRELGAALAANGMPVLSIVCYDSRSCDFPLVAREELAPGHIVERLPIYLTAQNPAGFLAAEHRIARAVRRALRLNAGRVGIVHVRFLDDASRAVARVARGCGVPVVTTLTPDPHRSVCDAEGRIEPRRGDAALELFNRILIGDDLLSWSQGIVAIGRTAFSDSLIHYYPQLEDTRGKLTAGIDEGVNTKAAAAAIDAAALLCDTGHELPLSRSQLAAPMLLSVGRLSPVKGQVNLVRAWASGGLWRRYNLVLVGGDFERPSAEEHEIQHGVRACLRRDLRGRLCHLPAQPNSVVRALLGWSSQREAPGGPDFYVCPSLKEEFGLSILEAMAEGLPVCAPIRGGPPAYIRHGANGFLIDTRDASVLRRELCAVLEAHGHVAEQLRRVKQLARRTVEERYSLAAMAAAYQRFYQRVLTEGEADGD